MSFALVDIALIAAAVTMFLTGHLWLGLLFIFLVAAHDATDGRGPRGGS